MVWVVDEQYQKRQVDKTGLFYTEAEIMLFIPQASFQSSYSSQ